MLSRDQRGLSQSVQLAVVWPLLLLVTLGLVQAGIWLHARDVAERAATAAVDVARGRDGTPAAAEELARDLARTGGLEDVSVQVTWTATQVTATVTAEAPALLDLPLARILETAAAPRERVTVP